MTSLRTQYSSAFELRTLFLLVADIYRRISFAPIKVRSYLSLGKSFAKFSWLTFMAITSQRPTKTSPKNLKKGLVVKQTVVLLILYFKTSPSHDILAANF